MMMIFPGVLLAPALHYGDIALVQELADLAMANVKKAIAAAQTPAREQPEAIGLVFGAHVWPLLAYHTRLFTAAQQDAVDTYLVEYGLSWSGADAKMDTIDHALIRKRSVTTMGANLGTTEAFAWLCKCGHVLVAHHWSRSRLLASAEIISALPSVPEMIKMIMCMDMWNWFHASCNAYFNLFIAAASVCEKLGAHERVLEYSLAAVDEDLTKAGSQLPGVIVLAHSMRGRALAALGRPAEAGKAFELAISEAHTCGLWLYEAFALRDLKIDVLDSMGHGEHGARRLGEALRQLAGPASSWTRLMKGMDAAELMSLPAPEAGYQVIYMTEPPPDHAIAPTMAPTATAKLQAELSGLRMSQLRRRAVDCAGLDAVEEADDSDDPRVALILLLLDASEAEPIDADPASQASAAAAKAVRTEPVRSQGGAH